ncbi:transcriptional regulator [Streptomyces sp. NPDC127066]|uniref:transcriptional regulator n=1 Tax=Streptomyces sp. NPDC127066 TaxID=3347125 RepID=UPI003646705A
MPERNLDLGKFGARGIKGHEAVARQLDALAGYIATPITARLHYLTRPAARDAGLIAAPRTIKAWLAGTRSPSRADLAAIERAYRAVRRENVARYLLARLNRDGRGTRVEIHPLNESQVTRPQQHVVEYRTLNVRHWGRIVAAPPKLLDKRCC